MTIEVRPMTGEDRVRYVALGGAGAMPVFVAEVDGLRAFGNHLDEVPARARQGLAHRAAMWRKPEPVEA